MLAVGGVDFNAPLEAEDSPVKGRDPLQPLPGSQIEVEKISQLHQRVFQQSCELLMQKQAHESRIKKELRNNYRYLHFATHGISGTPPENVLQMRQALAQGRPLPEAEVKQLHRRENRSVISLHRMGLALAGANRAPIQQSNGSVTEDSVLTAAEIQVMELRKTELAVLSADEGAELRRVFHRAGVKAVIASLWKGDDAATSVLMEAFYKNWWERKLTKLEALRQAQLLVLKNPKLVEQRRQEIEKRSPGVQSQEPRQPVKTSPPTHWAAFVFSGDWR